MVTANHLYCRWEERMMPDGRKYYVDHNTHTSTWHRPGDPLPTK